MRASLRGVAGWRPHGTSGHGHSVAVAPASLFHRRVAMQGLVRGERPRPPVHGAGMLALFFGATLASLFGTPAQAQEQTPVYTGEQATTGRTLYTETCARCGLMTDN